MGIFDGFPGLGLGGSSDSGSSVPPSGTAATVAQGTRPFGGATSVATSDFSVRELLMVEQAGFRAVGLCMGSSSWKLVTNLNFSNTAYELTDLTQAMYGAREKAMEIMRAEAEALGADGIVGTRLEIEQMSDSNLMEFKAFGTGIVHREGHTGYRRPDGRPFTSDLSGQDFVLALRAGRRPLDLVIGCCVQHIPRRGFMRTLSEAGVCVELDLFTQAFYTARDAAMARMTAHAEAVGANEIIGTRIEEENSRWGEHIVEFLAVGTAMQNTGTIDPDFRIDPVMTLDLDR